MKKPSVRILIIFIAFLILIQFFPPEKSVPATDPSADFVVVTNPRRKVTAMLHSSCFDCHSYKTSYPWYSDIAPVSWFLQSHIREGRENLNFSVYGTYPREKRYQLLSEMKEVIEKKEMPLRSYTLMHKNARLNDGMRETLIKWLSEGKNDIQVP